MILVDSNVLLDLLDIEHFELGAWSRSKMIDLASDETLAVNLVIRAEIAPEFVSVDEQSRFLFDLGIETLALDELTAFRAGQAFQLYRKRGGQRKTILPDFLIGAHAVTIGAALMTRDRQISRYFPELTLITPETEHG